MTMSIIAVYSFLLHIDYIYLHNTKLTISTQKLKELSWEYLAKTEQKVIHKFYDVLISTQLGAVNTFYTLP